MTSEHQNAPAQVIKYNPQLDGLRFFAVLFVVTYHWVPWIAEFKISYFFGASINFFFVLSSYLISRILLLAKEKSVSAGIPKYKVMLVFLFRRAIRIFPAYYFFLLVVILLPVIGNEVRNHAGIYFSYLVNYQMFHDQVWSPVTSHIWTLAVEEQFYIVWPFVMLFVPGRHLLKTFLLMLVCSVVFRLFTYHSFAAIPQVILTQYCLDPFAIGGLLAYKYTLPEQDRTIITRLSNIALYIAIPLTILIIVFQSYYFSFVIGSLSFSIISMKLIEGAILGYKGSIGRFIQSRMVLYIGKISYGIYLYHLLIPILFWKFFDKCYGSLFYHFPSFFNQNAGAISAVVKILAMPLSCYVIYAVLTLLTAILSWNFIEKPFFRLKAVLNSGQKK
jgi:peptidoglycan/LPS O-acetylase OafA/YrhL